MAACDRGATPSFESRPHRTIAAPENLRSDATEPANRIGPASMHPFMLQYIHFKDNGSGHEVHGFGPCCRRVD